MKRSPLVRKTPLRAKSEMKRGGPIKRKAKPKKSAALSDHVSNVAKMPCCVTGAWPVVVHHIMHMNGKDTRRDDRYIVPLIPALHNMGDLSVHMLGSERKFLEVHSVDLVAIAVDLWGKHETDTGSGG